MAARPAASHPSVIAVVWSHRLLSGLLVAALALVTGGVAVWLGSLGLDRADVPNDVPLRVWLAAAGVVAVTVPLAHRWIDPSVHDLLASPADTTTTALASVERHVEADSEPAVLLEALASSLARLLAVPFVAIEIEPMAGSMLDGWAEAQTASVGDRALAGNLVHLPVAFRGSTFGSVHVSGRRHGRDLSDDDRLLAADLVRHIALVVSSSRMSAAVQHSREQTVVAREEERRRLRRDLHDGLGPTLAAMKLQLAALQRRAPDARVTGAIDGLQAALSDATAEVRRLVYGLRPPMLDEHGLVESLRNLAFLPATLELVVDVDEPIAELPAAVEVAVLRIATEAIHNVVRHASARSCVVRLACHDDDVTVSIGDDGHGWRAPRVPGVGIRAIHERAEELGGMVSLGTSVAGGLLVVATLPLDRPAGEPSDRPVR